MSDDPIQLFQRWTLEFGVLGTIALLAKALEEKHQHYAPSYSTFLAYAEIIEEFIPMIETRFREKMRGTAPTITVDELLMILDNHVKEIDGNMWVQLESNIRSPNDEPMWMCTIRKYDIDLNESAYLMFDEGDDPLTAVQNCLNRWRGAK